MIPWPIALLVIWYAAIATAAAAKLWQMGPALASQSGWWIGLWAGLSLVLVIGLAWLKPWARMAAIGGSLLMTVGAILGALRAVAQVPPSMSQSLTAMAVASVNLVVIRYLTRPHVKAWFGSRLASQV